MSMRFSQGCKGMERTHGAPSNIIQQSMILGCHQGHLTTYTLHKSAQHIQFSLSRQWQLAKPRTSTSKCSFAAWLLQSTIRMVLNGSLLWGSARPAPISRLASYSWWTQWTHKFGIERIFTCRHSFFLSGLLVLFLHEGCTLTSQFDKQFWASVMACLNKTFLFRKW